MVSWDVCIMPKDEGGLGLTDVVTQGNILVSKCVIRCMKGSSPWQDFMQYRLILAPHVSNIIAKFGICEIIFSPHYFQIAGSFIFQSIWTIWKKVSILVHWQMSSSRVGWDLAKRIIWSQKQEGTCIFGLPNFLARRFSRKNIYFQRYLWDFNVFSWKNW